MKNLLTAALPALALLALGGCATTGAVTSTEDDGVYYSSKDRTTVAQAPATSYQNGGYSSNSGYGSAGTTAQATAGENANPDYQGGTTQSGTTGNTDYYDDNYSYNSVQPSGFGQPYTGPGVSSYNYTPSWSVSPSFYGSPYGYGSALSIGYGYGGFGGYSPFGFGYGYPAYGFYDPFYSPFYSPFYGYGSRFSIGFGYGFGGFGGFGYPYYGGYGYPGYAYGGYYGDYGYGGARNYVYKQNIVNGGYSNGYGGNGAILVGRRESRATNAVGNGNLVAPRNATVGASVPGGRQVNDGAASGFNRVVAPGSQPMSGFAGTAAGATAPAATGQARRFEQATANPNSPATAAGVSDGRAWGRMNNNSNAGYNQPRAAEMATPAGATTAPAAADNRRGGFFRSMFSAPANQGQGSNASNQGGFSQPQRSYSQPADRGFSQPRMEQRSFQPSQSSPSFGGSRGGSFGGGGGGGGSFGGGGGGGGRRGR